MKQEIEIEFKNLLTKDEYHQLIQQYPFPKQAVKQINYYFETDTFALKKYKCALRIREKNNTSTLTLKEPHLDGLLETHIMLSKEEANKYVAGHTTLKHEMNKKLLTIGVDPKELKFFGQLTTYRKEYLYKDMILVLDHSFYNDQEDFEFELEVPEYDKGKRFFQDILDDVNIDIRKTPNKIERFFSSL